MVAYFNDYTKPEVILLRKIEAAFSAAFYFFFIVAVSISFGFCFRLNIFTSKIWNLLLPLEAEGSGGCES